METKLTSEDIILEEIGKENVELLYDFKNGIEFPKNTISKSSFIQCINDYINDAMIKSKSSSKYYGFCNLIDINYVDRFAYIYVFIKAFSKNDYTNAVYKYIDFLFNLYPLRKIYYEVYSYEINNAICLKEIGFKIEVKYKNYKKDGNKFYSKYVLGLSRKDFYNNE